MDQKYRSLKAYQESKELVKHVYLLLKKSLKMSGMLCVTNYAEQ